MDTFEAVYQLVRLIPQGRVSTYGAIAKALGIAAPRVVGWALRQSIAELDDVPAHRVVNREGYLSGAMHFSTPVRMQELLESEGVCIEDMHVRDFKTLFWNPQTELGEI